MTIKPTTPEDNRIFLKGKQLAELLDVSAPSLSEAARKGRNCQGYPVAEWAVETDTGRIKGYNVPQFLVSEDTKQTPRQRANPYKQPPNEANPAPNKGQQPSGLAHLQEIHNTYSALPEGQDYIRPVSMATLSSVLKKALDMDTPQSRAVISALLAMIGAITGHAVTDKATGAGIGAGAGLGIAFLSYRYFEDPQPQDRQTNLPGNRKQHLVNRVHQTLKRSGYSS